MSGYQEFDPDNVADVMDMLQRMNLALQHAIFRHADLILRDLQPEAPEERLDHKISIAGGPTAFAWFPEWLQKTFDELATTIGKPFGENLRKYAKFKTIESHGIMQGISRRLVKRLTQELPEVLRELEEFEEDDLDPQKLQELETRLGALAESKGLKELPDSPSEVFAAMGESLKESFLNSQTVAENYDAENEAIYHTAMAKGFTAFLAPDGDYPKKHRNVKSKILSVFLDYWWEIEQMRNGTDPATRRELFEKVEAWGEWSDDEFEKLNEQNFYQICDKVGLKLAPPGRPQKTT